MSVNPGVWEGQIPCIRAATCSELATEELYEDCYEEAVALLIPSSTCVSFCEADSAASFECGGGYSVEACATEGTCTWSDSVLSKGLDCASEADCTLRAECLDAAFGGP